MADGLTFGAFAALLKVSRPAVSKAYKSKRLNRCIGFNAKGRPLIADVELAKREWTDNSSRPVTSVTDQAPEPDDEGARTTLSEAQRLVTLERARKLKLENDLREGQLVEVARVRAEFADLATSVKTRLRSIPDAIADQVVGVAALGPAAVKALLRTKIDDALRELARGAVVHAQADAESAEPPAA